MIPVSFGPVKEQLVNKWQIFLVFLLTKLRLDPISFVRYGTKKKILAQLVLLCFRMGAAALFTV